MNKKAKSSRKRQAMEQLQARVAALEEMIRQLGGAHEDSGIASQPGEGLFPAFFRRGLKQRYLSRIQQMLDTPEFDYFLFEYAYRGEREDIRQRQTFLVEQFLGKGNILDIGCGRGEFLELLKERFIPAYGIDLDRDNVLYCQEQGLEVSHEDAFDHLPQVPRGTLGGVYLGQVIEHMPPMRFLKLAHLCYRALKPGGIFIADTVNPQCLTALGWFWKDPTHFAPVPKDLALFILDQAGFVRCRAHDQMPVASYGRLERWELQPGDSSEMRALKETLNKNIDRLNETLYGYQEYAAIGYVPEESELPGEEEEEE